MRVKRFTLGVGIGLAALTLILVQGCPSDEQEMMSFKNGAGEQTKTIGTYDSLIVGLDGLLEPKTQYRFRVTPQGADEPILGLSRLTTDQYGALPSSILLYDVGHGTVPEGTYDVEVSGPNLHEVVSIVIGPRQGPYIFSCDSSGAVANSFELSEIAYAAGGNFAPNTEFQLVLNYDRPSYREGDYLDMGLGLPLPPFGEPRRTDASGNIPVTQLTDMFLYVQPGDGFDVVADFAPFGIFNEATDAVDGYTVVGLTYQALDVGSDVDSELACDAMGVYTDTFRTTDDIYAWINPPLQYQTQYTFVDKYVVHHRDEWKDGDLLQDVSGANETDGVQSGCTNEQSVLVFPAPVPPGRYDVIMDMNRDGRYTQGVDIVDGGSAESLGKVGFTVE